MKKLSFRRTQKIVSNQIGQISPIRPICLFNFGGSSVQVASLCKSCRYHRHLGQKYDPAHLSPQGLCLSAYQTAYPYCLALLYNADLGKKVIVRCPNPKNYIEMEITKSPIAPTALIALKRKLLSLLANLCRPFDLPDHRITIKIVSQKGVCPKNYSIGQTFKFNLYRQNEICPAGFYQLYPFLIQVHKKPIFVSCPDDNVVVYKVSNLTNSSNQSNQLICQKFLKLNTLCPLLLYSLYPYYLTLSLGGHFDWVKKGEPVIVSCPNPKGIVLGVSLNEKNKVIAQIKKNKGSCPKKYLVGLTFELRNLETLRE